MSFPTYGSMFYVPPKTVKDRKLRTFIEKEFFFVWKKSLMSSIKKSFNTPKQKYFFSWCCTQFFKTCWSSHYTL